MANLSDENKDKVLGGNAMDMFGLSGNRAVAH
jgi:predicted TIM-barrel fold metal-dependent hydrolase